MRWLSLLLLAGCATHDVLHAEGVARRAACGDDGLAIFGFPRGETDCAADVIALGDACFAVETPAATRLVECAAAAPDGHVMCLEDPHGEAPLFEGDPVAVRARVWQRAAPWTSEVTLGRCRSRFRAWSDVHGVAAPAPELVLVSWHALDGRRVPDPPPLRFTPDLDTRALRRLLPGGWLRATACPIAAAPGVAVTDLPVPLAPAIGPAIVDAFVRWRLPLRRCQQLLIAFAGAHVT